MNPDKTEIILGPPGTGKTTKLLEILERSLKSFRSETISFISFTRKAANEAAFRACEALNKERDEFPLFRTMHSIAYEYLSINRSNIVIPSDYFTIAKKAGTFINFSKGDKFNNPEGLAAGNKILSIISYAKNNEVELKEAWEILGGINWIEVENFNKIYTTYKKEKNKLDFDDIIHKYASEGIVPNINVLFIDEAQDLSKAQWKMAERLSKKTHVNYVAGDDDQSIYQWAGACTESFINLEGKPTTLSYSYRIPKSVHSLAISITKKIKNRRDKHYKPCADRDGMVIFLQDIFQIPFCDKESWLLLGRNNSQLVYYEKLCEEYGLPFVSVNPDEALNKIITAVTTWKELRAGGHVLAKRAKICYEYMRPVERVALGGKKKLQSLNDSMNLCMNDLRNQYGCVCSDYDWDYALDKLDDKGRAYLKAIESHPDFYEPKITISTIHGAKGGEADNVVLATDMGQLTYRSYTEEDQDAEHRVWYVGVTRTKNKLYIIQPQTDYYYEL